MELVFVRILYSFVDSFKILNESTLSFWRIFTAHNRFSRIFTAHCGFSPRIADFHRSLRIFTAVFKITLICWLHWKSYFYTLFFQRANYWLLIFGSLVHCDQTYLIIAHQIISRCFSQSLLLVAHFWKLGSLWPNLPHYCTPNYLALFFTEPITGCSFLEAWFIVTKPASLLHTKLFHAVFHRAYY